MDISTVSINCDRTNEFTINILKSTLVNLHVLDGRVKGDQRVFGLIQTTFREGAFIKRC